MTEAEREFLCLIIGHRVRELRKSRRLSQHELANGVGSQSMISLIESGRQLPPPDVLDLIANRLDDALLKRYAEGLENNTLDHFHVSSHNEEDLMSILVNHRGRWQPAHERIASQLCHHYYYTRSFEQVKELCHLIIHHVYRRGLLAEAYFYLGSSLLFEHRFEDAEHWLRKADEHRDALTESLQGRVAYNLGYAYTYLDVQVLALWYASRSVEIFHRMNDFLNQGSSLGLLGTIQQRLGMLEEAKKSLCTAYDVLSRWSTVPEDKSRIATTLAEVCALLGQHEEATSYSQTAISTVPAYDFLCQADIYRIKTYLAIQAGRREEALSYVSLGIRAAESANDTHNLTQFYLMHVQLLSDAKERLHAAHKAFQITSQTSHHILHALAAECIAHLLEQDVDAKEDSKEYMQAALDAYRTYVRKNSMFTNLIDNLPFYDSYFEKIDRQSAI
ncbi:helix-turn-helix domain-containing protein [Alicyclobacillus fastidiosus]|uniref:Helix-turn-helix domain-containing protein n=1 Tax=Alicyclobacillus fastidiosus TaxID=392011 RepID=A0ABY6ZKI8_9BACL|nr:helix-turn-helix transcriptional regulator [Alicyclobacillus fastidiosus]WAH42626.1 helix-turn-helix domain-containing protein [Alicyclobacillus fastidiosus]GMA64498.1 hypothetical protein GCM10025859_49380 [Alicyclobacillus fastidiosus]